MSENVVNLPVGEQADPPPIAVSGVTKSFADVEVLRGIDLTVRQSEVVCVIGPSGSGKSTLLRCIAFLEAYDGGDVRIAGRLLGYRDAGGRRMPAGEREIDDVRVRARHGVPALQSLAAHDRPRQRHRGVEGGAGDERGRPPTRRAWRPCRASG